MKKVLIMLLLALLVNNLSAQDTCGTSTVIYAGKTYHTVLIGSQCWLKENLNVGTMVPGWDFQPAGETIEKYCYDGLESNCDIYGGLYQWSEAMHTSYGEGDQGICPTGWHIPTDAEFHTLASEVGNSGNALKSVGQGYGGGEGTNTSGFSMLLAGYRSNTPLGYDYRRFGSINQSGTIWSSTNYSATHYKAMHVWDNQTTIYFDPEHYGSGLSVRCLAIMPTAVSLSSPVNNATDQVKQASLSWVAISGATGYQVQIASDVNFSNIVSNQTPSTNSASASGLTFLSTYYWRVRAINSAGFVGNWSSISKFNTIAAIDNALSFDGINDYVDATSNASFDLTTGITLEGWIKTTSTSEQYIMDKDGSYWLSVSTPGAVGKAGIWLLGVSSDWTLSSRTVNDGNWHHVAASWDNTSNTISIYIDGTLDFSTSKGGTITASGNSVEIGRRTTYGYFNGTMDELRIWNIARTESEIASNKNNINLSPTSSGLIACYHFDQGTAGVANPTVTTLTDTTSNALNGTLTNFGLTGSSSNWVTATTGAITPSSVGTNMTVFQNVNFGLSSQSGTIDATVELVSSAPLNMDAGSRSIGKYWDITSLSGPTKIRLYYTATDKASFTGTPKIYHYTGGAWVELPTSAEVTGVPYNYVETTNYYSSFSPVTVGDANAPLPVELTSFSASASNNVVTLQWQTATEVNNYGFEIERIRNEELGITNWDKIGFIAGHGNSNSVKHYSFTDADNLRSKVKYRLKQLDNDGSFKYSPIVESKGMLPNKFELYQNYPNPFNPQTNFQFDLPIESAVKLIVFNSLGEQVEVLVNEVMQTGFHTVQFNASHLASGLYFYRIQADGFVQTKKMILMK